MCSTFAQPNIIVLYMFPSKVDVKSENFYLIWWNIPMSNILKTRVYFSIEIEEFLLTRVTKLEKLSKSMG